MLITFRLGTLAHIHFLMSSALLASAMAADRVFALGLPFVYKNIKHSRHQIAAAVICFTLPSLVSVSYIWELAVIQKGDRFSVTHDEDYAATTSRRVLVGVESVLRVSCIVCLILLNFIMIILFQKRNRKVAQMTNSSEEKRNQKKDRTLLFVNLTQSVLMCLNQVPHVALHEVLLYPGFQQCAVTIVMPLVDACIFLTDSMDLFVLLAVNKKMRQKVVSAMKCQGDNQVATTS